MTLGTLSWLTLHVSNHLKIDFLHSVTWILRGSPFLVPIKLLFQQVKIRVCIKNATDLSLYKSGLCTLVKPVFPQS